MTTLAPPDVVRAEIARAILGTDALVEALGRVILQPHQHDAVARIERAMRELGGALLADETGLGKTYVALAIARRARRPIVVAPAALRPMWRRAMSETDCAARFVSIESLGRRRGAPERAAPPASPPPLEPPDLVIVDEAHQVRNPATARYRALASLTAGARVLLLSATPVHNSMRDLDALLALFLGTRAAALDPAIAARSIVRRAHADARVAAIPAVDRPVALPIAHDDRMLAAILALPPSVPLADGEDGGVLLTYSLIRQWASSQGAFAAALRRRLARGVALLSALESGRLPTAAELRAWAVADSTIQLALPGLVVAPDRGGPLPESERHAFVTSIDRHATAIRALLSDLRRGPDSDGERAARLAELRDRHAGERIVAFTQFAETVDAIFDRLRHRSRVGALTSVGARVAGGALSRAEAIARFAPRAQGVAPPSPAHEIDLLITTDLLSEGVNLQDASVVVHLDVPWTPARLEQRVGRLARLGSPHARIHVYAMQPPASASDILTMEARLHAKLRAAARTIGIVGAIVPSLFPGAAAPATAGPAAGDGDRAAGPRAAEAMRALAEEWLRGASRRGENARRGGHEAPTGADEAPTGADEAPTGADEAPTGADEAPTGADEAPTRGEEPANNGEDARDRVIVAAVRAAAPGWIALFGDDARRGGERGRSLIAARISRPVVGHSGIQGVTSDAPDVVLHAMRVATRQGVGAPDHAVARALGDAEHWRAQRRVQADLAIGAGVNAGARRRVIERIAAITRRAPKHLRPSIASLAATARRTVTARFGAGAECVLAELAAAPMADEPWLRAVKAFGELHAGGDPREGADRLHALLLLVGD